MEGGREGGGGGGGGGGREGGREGVREGVREGGREGGLAHAHPNWLVEHMRSLSAHVVCKFHLANVHFRSLDILLHLFLHQ